MSEINAKSPIVELFSANLVAPENVVASELKDANDFIKELCANPNPNNRYEIAQILRLIVDNQLDLALNYLPTIADVKHIDFGQKAQFQIDLPGVKAFFQAKGSTTERSKVGHTYTTLETDEVSVRPAINFYDLLSGKTDFSKVATESAFRMEMAIAAKVQKTLYDAFSAMSAPNYGTGNGVVASVIDPIIYALARLGGVSIMGDIECISKFTALTGFNSIINPEYVKEHNQNGHLGTYKTANIVKMNNQLVQENLTDTVLRKDLLYIVPTGTSANRPLKVVLEGQVSAMEATSINDKMYEVRMDKYVGVGVVGYRKFLGLYKDSSLS